MEAIARSFFLQSGLFIPLSQSEIDELQFSAFERLVHE